MLQLYREFEKNIDDPGTLRKLKEIVKTDTHIMMVELNKSKIWK